MSDIDRTVLPLPTPPFGGKIGRAHTETHFPLGCAWAGHAPLQWVKQVASHLGSTRNPNWDNDTWELYNFDEDSVKPAILLRLLPRSRRNCRRFSVRNASRTVSIPLMIAA